MTVRLELKPEVEERVIAQAKARGVAVEAYLQSVVEEAAQKEVPDGPMDLKRLNEALDAFAITDRQLPALSDYALSREGMYEDHD